MDNETHVIKAGSTAHGQFETDVSIERAGWEWSSIRVLALPAGGSETVTSGVSELLVLPLSGGCAVEVNGETHVLNGREEVWSAITDYLYIPRETTFTVRSESGGRFALPAAKATRDLPVRYCPVTEVVTTLRGAGPCSRQVNNYALGNDLETSHLLACEVLTPGGNWSSYPAHKHDEHSENERELEEIYYFEIASGPDGSAGFGLHRTYGTPERPIDLCTEVHDGDTALVPHGYHGPCVAAPGYDMYYLNVMAGPSEDLVWLAPDDPAHHWIRASWEGQEVDPRLPMTK